MNSGASMPKLAALTLGVRQNAKLVTTRVQSAVMTPQI